MYAFYKKYFLINFKDYPALGFDFPITIILSCFVVALIITTVVVNYKRGKIEEMVSALTRHKAFDEQSAKTLSELNLHTKSFIRLLSGDGQITKTVGRVGEKKLSYEEFIEQSKSKKYKEDKIDFNEARFYIREEGRERAKRILEMGTPTPLSTALFCLLLVAIYICIALLMPGILSGINAFLLG